MADPNPTPLGIRHRLSTQALNFKHALGVLVLAYWRQMRFKLSIVVGRVGRRAFRLFSDRAAVGRTRPVSKSYAPTRTGCHACLLSDKPLSSSSPCCRPFFWAAKRLCSNVRRCRIEDIQTFSLSAQLRHFRRL